jgi:hypothetical protein
LRRVRDHFALGPLLALRIDAAQRKTPHDQSRWDRGVEDMARSLDNPRSWQGAAQAVVSALVGVFAGVLAPLPLGLQLAIGGVSALLAYWAVPTAGALVSAITAPRRQRNEARKLLGQREEQIERAEAAVRVARICFDGKAKGDRILERIDARRQGILDNPGITPAGAWHEVFLWLTGTASELEKEGRPDWAARLRRVGQAATPTTWDQVHGYASERVAWLHNWGYGRDT